MDKEEAAMDNQKDPDEIMKDEAQLHGKMEEVGPDELDQAAGGRQVPKFQPTATYTKLLVEISKMETKLKQEGKSERIRALAIMEYARAHGADWDLKSAMDFISRK